MGYRPVWVDNALSEVCLIRAIFWFKKLFFKDDAGLTLGVLVPERCRLILFHMETKYPTRGSNLGVRETRA